MLVHSYNKNQFFDLIFSHQNCIRIQQRSISIYWRRKEKLSGNFHRFLSSLARVHSFPILSFNSKYFDYTLASSVVVQSSWSRVSSIRIDRIDREIYQDTKNIHSKFEKASLNIYITSWVCWRIALKRIN